MRYLFLATGFAILSACTVQQGVGEGSADQVSGLTAAVPGSFRLYEVGERIERCSSYVAFDQTATDIKLQRIQFNPISDTDCGKPIEASPATYPILDTVKDACGVLFSVARTDTDKVDIQDYRGDTCGQLGPKIQIRWKAGALISSLVSDDSGSASPVDGGIRDATAPVTDGSVTTPPDASGPVVPITMDAGSDAGVRDSGVDAATQTPTGPTSASGATGSVESDASDGTALPSAGNYEAPSTGPTGGTTGEPAGAGSADAGASTAKASPSASCSSTPRKSSSSLGTFLGLGLALVAARARRSGTRAARR